MSESTARKEHTMDEDMIRDRQVEIRRERYEEILAEQADRDPFDGLPAFDNVSLPGLS